MALIVKDRIKETTTTTGTGTVTLAGASDGFQAFSVIGDTNATYYAIVSGDNWEVGAGTYTASGTTLSRTSILESSNSGSAITLSGTSDVFCTYPAEKAVILDSANQMSGTDVVITANIVDVNVTTAKIANDAVTLAKMAVGTDGNLISYDTSGDPVAVATGTSGQVLTSAGAGAVPSFQAAASAAVANGTMYENTAIVSSNYTLTSGSNAMSVGPITINSGVAVTVPSGQKWVVL